MPLYSLPTSLEKLTNNLSSFRPVDDPVDEDEQSADDIIKLLTDDSHETSMEIKVYSCETDGSPGGAAAVKQLKAFFDSDKLNTLPDGTRLESDDPRYVHKEDWQIVEGNRAASRPANDSARQPPPDSTVRIRPTAQMWGTIEIPDTDNLRQRLRDYDFDAWFSPCKENDRSTWIRMKVVVQEDKKDDLPDDEIWSAISKHFVNKGMSVSSVWGRRKDDIEKGRTPKCFARFTSPVFALQALTLSFVVKDRYNVTVEEQPLTIMPLSPATVAILGMHLAPSHITMDDIGKWARAVVRTYNRSNNADAYILDISTAVGGDIVTITTSDLASASAFLGQMSPTQQPADFLYACNGRGLRTQKTYEAYLQYIDRAQRQKIDNIDRQATQVAPAIDALQQQIRDMQAKSDEVQRQNEEQRRKDQTRTEKRLGRLVVDLGDRVAYGLQQAFQYSDTRAAITNYQSQLADFKKERRALAGKLRELELRPKDETALVPALASMIEYAAQDIAELDKDIARVTSSLEQSEATLKEFKQSAAGSRPTIKHHEVSSHPSSAKSSPDVSDDDEGREKVEGVCPSRPDDRFEILGDDTEMQGEEADHPNNHPLPNGASPRTPSTLMNSDFVPFEQPSPSSAATTTSQHPVTAQSPAPRPSRSTASSQSRTATQNRPRAQVSPYAKRATTPRATAKGKGKAMDLANGGDHSMEVDHA